MKKIFYLILTSLLFVTFSCKDDSGLFEEQLFTDGEITSALRKAIEFSSDTAAAHLCISDTLKHKLGFTYYDEGAYKIELPTQAKRVIDTLRKDSVYAKMIDTLIFKINRAAELTGNRIKSDVLTSIITNITFPNPHKTLHGKVDAITNYVKINYELLFINQLTSSILSEQFNKLKIIQTWNELQQHYFEITGLYSSIDILTPSAKKLEEGFFKEMAIEEELIRTDPTHRGPTTGNFRAIFATIK